MCNNTNIDHTEKTTSPPLNANTTVSKCDTQKEKPPDLDL